MHDFKERLAFSEGIKPGDALLNSVMEMVPNADRLERACTQDDREGTDFWILRTHGLRPLSIDMKNRSYCPIEKFGSDDACIETTSVYLGQKPYLDCNRKKPGWTVDFRKKTDFVVYTWPNAEGVRFWIVPFVPLCAAARKNWRDWSQEYGERPAHNENYTTLSVYVPRLVIARSMQKFMTGVAA